MSRPQHHTYALAGRQDPELSPDVVPGILLVFFYNVYASIDLGFTMVYIAPYIAERIGLKPEPNQTSWDVSATSANLETPDKR